MRSSRFALRIPWRWLQVPRLQPLLSCPSSSCFCRLSPLPEFEHTPPPLVVLPPPFYLLTLSSPYSRVGA